MKKLFAMILLVISHYCSAQIISTFAGNGINGNTGDGGPATAAEIGYPVGGVFDASGNYYFALGTVGNCIRKIAPSGIITTVAGNGTAGFSGDGGQATAAKLNNPQAVTVDTLGNLYIADDWNNRIRKVNNTTGIITTIAGMGTGTYSGDGSVAIRACLYNPEDVCFDRMGNLYIADAVNCRIRKINTYGIISTVAGNGSSGTLAGDGGPATNAVIAGAIGLCTDDTGNLYIADGLRVRKVDTFGIIYSIAGNDTATSLGDGGLATNAEIGAIKITIDPLGNIYICSNSGHRARVINSARIINTIAGTGIAGSTGDGGPSDSAEIDYPAGVTTDRCNNLYIAEAQGFRIRKVTIPSALTIATLAITANPNDTLCPGMPITFTATATLGGSSPAYKWVVNGDTLTVSGGTYSYVPAAGDSVQCILFSSSPCAAPAVVGSNVIHIVPRNVSVSLSGPGAAALGSSVTIGATVTGAATGGYTLQWSNKGVFMSTTTVPSLTYTKTMSVDSITTKLIAIFEDCSDTAESEVHVVVDSVTSTPGPFSTSGEGVTCYPSPASNDLNISNVPLKCTYQLHNIMGTTVAHGILNAGNNTLSLHELPPGLYMLEIVGEDGVREVRKVVKE